MLAKKNSNKIYEYNVLQAEKAQKHTFNFLQTKTAQKWGIWFFYKLESWKSSKNINSIFSKLKDAEKNGLDFLQS